MSPFGSSQPNPATSGNGTQSTSNKDSGPSTSKEAPVLDPESLINDFKSSGEFDKFKASVQAQFMSDEFIGSLRSQVESVVRARLQNEEMLTYMPPAHALNDLQQNLNRDGVVERFITEEYIAKVFDEKAQGELSAELSKTLEKLFKPKLDSITEHMNAALNAETSTLETTPIPPPAPESSPDKPEKKEDKSEPSVDKEEVPVMVLSTEPPPSMDVDPKSIPATNTPPLPT